MRTLVNATILTSVVFLNGCELIKPDNQLCPLSNSSCGVIGLRQLCPSGIKTDDKATWFRGISIPALGKGTTIGDITYTPMQLQKISELATELDQQNVTMCMVLEVFRSSKNGTTAELVQLVSVLNKADEKSNNFVSLVSSSAIAKQAAPNVDAPSAAAISSITKVAESTKAEVTNATANLPAIDPALILVPEAALPSESSK